MDASNSSSNQTPPDSSNNINSNGQLVVDSDSNGFVLMYPSSSASDSPVMVTSNSFSNQTPPDSSNHLTDSLSDSAVQHIPDLEGYVIVDLDSDSEELASTHPSWKHPSSLASDSQLMAASKSFSNQTPSNSSNHPADSSSSSSVPRLPAGLEGCVIIGSDSDADGVRLMYPSKSASDGSDRSSVKVYTSRQERFCTSKFCGVSGIEHSKGPYLHKGQPARAMPRVPQISPQPFPPWEKANPPPEVWDAWINSYPIIIGPQGRNFHGHSLRCQEDIDLVEGFTAHHSWIRDDTFEVAERKYFNRWCENWKKQRE